MLKKLMLGVACLMLLVEVRSVVQSRVLGSKSGEAEIIVTGDIMLGRTVMVRSLDRNDPAYPFIYVADVLRKADLVFSNLENPIVKDCPRHTVGFKFCADPKMVEGLKFAGVDIVTIANNHTLNYGRDGFLQTKKYLGDNGIEFTGAGNLVTKQINGIRFGFLGFEFLSKGLGQSELDLIAESEKRVDILLVGIHWGVEYTDKPTVFQKEWANQILAAGADVIVGHHPHWVQKTEYISGKPVFWSLGNFVFDQMWSEKTREGMAVRLSFEDKKLVKVEELPVYMKEWARPVWKETGSLIPRDSR